MSLRLLTIGVYGFSEEGFFHTLVDAGVDTFCDVRRRRGLRGAKFAFANSNRLQRRLQELGIRYVHLKNLAPSNSTRALQKAEDQQVGQLKRNRTQLSAAFVDAYSKECLSASNLRDALATIGPSARTAVLFCVEREPGACHRSLAAESVAQAISTEPEHLLP